MPPALALDGIVKHYGAVRALDGGTLTVDRGTLHAVLGENGAGKTTLMRVAFGLVRPDAGQLLVDGRPRTFASPRDATAAGIGMVHQHFTLVPSMTVAENVALGGHGRFDPRAAATQVRTLGDATGLHLDPAAPAASLGVAAQQRLEILKALARSGTDGGTTGRLLILDEPAAVLAPAEADDLLRWLRSWVDAGGTAVLVTHKLRDALRYADAATVLRHGRTALASPRPLDERALLAAMLGETTLGETTLGETTLGETTLGETAPRETVSADAAPAANAPSHPSHAAGPVVARLAHVHSVDAAGVTRLRDASLDLHAGTVVGIAAVEGNGQRELLRLLAGRLAPTTGTVEHPATVAFIPEDRHADALLLDAPLADNLALVGAGPRRGRIRWPQLRARTATLVATADVRGGTPATAARALSGGNQQKFVVARELDLDPAPRLVVAENPTRGLDVRAAAAVRDRLRAAATDGAAVVVHSTDLDEVLALADEVVVVYDGTLRHLRSTPPTPPDRTPVDRIPLDRTSLDRDLVGRLMLGASS